MLHAGVDFDKCGASAVQRMSGEDPDKLSRTAQQRAQVFRSLNVARAGAPVYTHNPQAPQEGHCAVFVAHTWCVALFLLVAFSLAGEAPCCRNRSSGATAPLNSVPERRLCLTLNLI